MSIDWGAKIKQVKHNNSIVKNNVSENVKSKKNIKEEEVPTVGNPLFN
tara:strand:+ start:1816 stop:1959 length:144 start_codon:yes stop_codon:yes gene_type:complete